MQHHTVQVQTVCCCTELRRVPSGNWHQDKGWSTAHRNKSWIDSTIQFKKKQQRENTVSRLPPHLKKKITDQESHKRIHAKPTFGNPT